jgi:hypothetical protein
MGRLESRHVCLGLNDHMVDELEAVALHEALKVRCPLTHVASDAHSHFP